MEQPAPPANLLSYADFPARHGIQYEIRPDGVTFVLPRPPWWRRVEVILLIGLVPFIGGTNLYEAISEKNTLGIIASGAVTAVLVWAAVFTARQSSAAVIELTPDTFRADNVRPVVWSDAEAGANTMSLPRADVYDVHYVEHSGNIVVHVRGREMIEFKPSRDARVARWIAQELRRALGLSA
jgi:hypothetical protein